CVVVRGCLSGDKCSVSSRDSVPVPAFPFPPFLLSTRPPPLSTLFPYTTLFRSRCRLAAYPPGHWRWWSRRHIVRPAIQQAHRHRDRKSTRLNSSHVSISYAVFCLKKKKHTSL